MVEWIRLFEDPHMSRGCWERNVVDELAVTSLVYDEATI